MARFHITIVRPVGYLHSSCFVEVAEGLLHGLRALGHQVSFQENFVDLSACTILLGAHLLDRETAVSLPRSVVVYNLEQLGSNTFPDWYRTLARTVAVWDYTWLNVQHWRDAGCTAPIKVVEVGYVPELNRIAPAPEQDIEVLFYGAITERRHRVLQRLQDRGVRVHVAFGVYGAERDALIARSRLVLNVHATDLRVFEAVRVSYLLANAKAVVSEDSEDSSALRDAVATCCYTAVCDVCERLLASEEERRALEQRGFHLFSQRSQAGILALALR